MTSPSSHEFFDHTADVGVRVEAGDVDSLFEEAARALFAFFVRDPAAVRTSQEIVIHLEADTLEDLLVDWLQELLVAFEVRHLLLGRFEARVDGTILEGRAWGEPLDRTRHVLGSEVKAVTYHGLRVEERPRGLTAEFVLDI